MLVVRFPAYRRFSEARIEVNDAMMALLIGARLGEHALKTSAADPDALLPSLFGQISGISRLNRTAGDAAHLLSTAETHLVYMAIPYALAIHGSFMVSAARMARQDGKDAVGHGHAIPRVDDLSKLPLELAHEYMCERCGAQLRGTMLPLFHLARRIRNRIVHFGGTPGSHLMGEYRALPPEARETWEQFSRRPLGSAITDGKLALLEGELVAVLAISRHLGQQVSELLGRKLSRRYWADVVIDDYRELYPQRFGERERQLRRLRGFATRMYSPLHLTPDELEEGARRTREGGSSY